MAFNPDAYLAKKSSGTGDSFDPDAYLAKQAPTDDGKGWARGLVRSLPTAGAVFGGAAGTPLGPLGMVGGAGFGAAGGKAAQTLLETVFDLEEPATREKLYKDLAKEGLIGAAGEGIGQSIAVGARGIGGLLKARGAAKAAEKTTSVIPEVIENVPGNGHKISEEMFALNPKQKALEIQAAAEKMGVKPTQGMISGNSNVQNLESALMQKPTVAGEIIRREYRPIFEKTRFGAEKLAGSSENNPLTPFEVGDVAKRGLLSKIGEKVDPLKASYQEIAESTKNIPVAPEAASRVTTRLGAQDVARIKGMPSTDIVEKYTGFMNQAKNADDLQRIASQAKADLRAIGGGPESIALQKIIGATERLQRRAMLEGGKKIGPEGIAEAKSLIDQGRKTNKAWRQMMGEFSESLQMPGLKTSKNPQDLAKSMENLTNEKMTNLFNVKNVGGLKSLKSFDPDTFETLRKSRLGDIAQKSEYKGEISPKRLVSNLSKLPKDAQELLLGADGPTALKDLKTLVDSFPENVGPSGTPRGIEWMNYLNPGQYLAETRDALQLLRLKGQSLPNPVRPIQRGLINPRVTSLGAQGLLRSQQKEESR